ncbi:nitroreductase [Penicillium riverlandense]|uniref:nitroreductase n=1 Tax=Penicillium riverlandense TaxID=1903569 RepID=UPI002547CF7D|nr:nitroreductase [Penicillium riverlandense]KAJ5820378.1 nitroreductase [Penicillium riverlandense]
MPNAYHVPFFEAIKIRRSTVALAKESPISDERIVVIVNHAIKHAPSPFSVQSCRAIVLFGTDHEKMWDIGHTEMKKTMPAPVFANFVDKIAGYKAAYGTVLFFEDTKAVEKLPPPLQSVIGSHPEWYEHSNGMNQYIAWTALCAEGLGCNLQHFNPQVNKAVAETWNVPESWNLRAQLVFGKPTGPPRGGLQKAFAPLEGRVLVHGNGKEHIAPNGI